LLHAKHPCPRVRVCSRAIAWCEPCEHAQILWACLMVPAPRPCLPHEVGGYRLGRRIGSGSYGEVYLGSRPGHEDVAIKLEALSVKRSQLKHEWSLYNRLAGGPGIPQVYWYGTVDNYNALVMELLGPSLEELFRRCGNMFSAETVRLCAEQMIQRLQHIHSRGILHRDVKPNNFLVGRGESANQIYLVDFGLSKSYVDAQTQRHIPYRAGRKGLTGTARYTSIGNHLGIEVTRRDDLEGLGYVLIRMLRGRLPWQGIKADTKQMRNELISNRKIAITLQELCCDLPQEFLQYMTICRNLKFKESPPYAELQGLMLKALVGRHCDQKLVFDWDTLRSSSCSSSRQSTRAASDRSAVHSADANGAPASPGTREHISARRRKRGGGKRSRRGRCKVHARNKAQNFELQQRAIEVAGHFEEMPPCKRSRIEPL